MSETGLSLVTAPTVEPIDLDDAKTHLKIDVEDDDELIASWIKAARGHVETFTHRAVPLQTWDYALDCVPYDGVIWLPMAPGVSVTSVSYVDTAGATQVWASSNYRTDLPTGPKARKGRITAAYSVPWPTMRNVTGALTVRFVCGYAPAAVPAEIKAAMRLLIGHWYENREAVVVDIGNVTEIPLGVASLLWPFKSW